MSQGGETGAVGGELKRAGVVRLREAVVETLCLEWDSSPGQQIFFGSAPLSPCRACAASLASVRGEPAGCVRIWGEKLALSTKIGVRLPAVMACTKSSAAGKCWDALAGNLRRGSCAIPQGPSVANSQLPVSRVRKINQICPFCPPLRGPLAPSPASGAAHQSCRLRSGQPKALGFREVQAFSAGAR